MREAGSTTNSPGSSRETAICRPAARVLLIDPADRVLLFLVGFGGRRLWITPGGGLEPGESFDVAARRELLEETGIRCDLGPCVWVRRHVFLFEGPWVQGADESRDVWIDEVEQFFVARVDTEVTVSREGWLPHEHRFMSEHRWWTVGEIAASTDYFAPRAMAALLPAVIRAEDAGEPLEIDDSAGATVSHSGDPVIPKVDVSLRST